MEKIRLIYDATILKELNSKTSDRTGVYFLGYYIFMHLIDDARFEITAYSSPSTYLRVRRALESEQLRRYNIKIANYGDYPESVNKFFDRYNEWWLSLAPLPRWQRRLYKGLTLPVMIAQRVLYTEKRGFTRNHDIFFSPTTTDLPASVMQDKSIKKVVFLHDIMPMLFPEYYPETRNISYPLKRLIKQLKDSGSSIYGMANSVHTKEDFMKLLPAEMDARIYVSMVGCGERFRQNTDPETAARARRKYNIPDNADYIFSLCTLEPRKNLIRAVRCFVEFIRKNGITDLYFVLGGAHWDMFIAALEKTIDGLEDYKKYIIQAGYVDDEDLPVLYSNAMWLVYTSQYEGFGAPPLEAMSCGCPVITSNNSSLPEVVGDAGIMIDWDSDEQHIEAYERYYNDPQLRRQMAEKGLRRAEDFTWEKIGDAIADKLAQLAQGIGSFADTDGRA